MVVNVTGYTLFATSQYDVILTFGVGLAKFVDTTCNIILHQWFSTWGRDPVGIVCLFSGGARASDKNIHNFVYILYFAY